MFNPNSESAIKARLDFHKESCDAFMKSIDSCLPSPDTGNIEDFYCPDVVGARSFVQNHGGHPKSDVAAINEAANLEMKMNLLNALQEIPVDESNSGLSDAEIMLKHKSKYQQTPSEILPWLEQQIAVRDAKRSQLEKSSDQKIDFKSDEEVIDNA